MSVLIAEGERRGWQLRPRVVEAASLPCEGVRS